MPLKDKPKRIREVQTLIQAFNLQYSPLLQDYQCNIIEDAPQRITDTYEVLLDSLIKQFIKEESRAQIFKVASGLELATVYVRPVRSSALKNLEYETNLNALLANYIAGAFLLQGRHSSLPSEFHSHLDEECFAVYMNHLEFLRYVSLDNLPATPIFSNSVYWQAYEVMVKFDLHFSQ